MIREKELNTSNKKIVIFVILAFIMSVKISFANVIEYQIEEQTENDFVAGQVWNYVTRDHEKKSKLTILKVDYFEDAVVVHIRLDNINLVDPGRPQGFRTVVPHMAFLQTALQQSVISLESKNQRLPEFSKEYQLWREGDGIGTAWAWHFSVSEALVGLEKIYSAVQQSSSIEVDNKQNSNN